MRKCFEDVTDSIMFASLNKEQDYHVQNGIFCRSCTMVMIELDMFSTVYKITTFGSDF